ncbi:MAG: outer membrane protein transport protein [Desulfuromonadaceae bacterium]|nr:outer membrane protein transport protein [Desulfuromonadaceae bacterium]
MKNKLVFACIMGTLAGTASLSVAAGFKINEQGAKGMGMANAFAAQADDPTALFYNPAGIAFLKGTQVSLGSLVIAVPQTEFSGTTPLTGNLPLGNGTSPVYEMAKRDLFIAPTLYATYSLETIPLSFGLGVNSIYPLAKSWDNSGSFRNQIENLAIKPINFQPTVAYRFDDLKLAIAAGLDVTHAIVTLQKSAYTSTITGGAPYGAFELGELGVDGTATDVGWNAGLLWKPRNDLSFGVAYRSEITLHITGDANFLATSPAGLGVMGIDYTTIPNSALPFTRTRFTSTASTTITLPDSLTLAVAWKPVEKLTLEFDAERTGWSSYDKLEIAFDSSSKLNVFNNNPSPKHWKDVWAYKVGGQYAYNKNLDLRAGYAYDTNPIPDSTLGPELPDSDRHNLSMGLGVHNEYAALDCAYMWVHWVDRTSNNQDNMTLTGQNGTFKSDAHLFGANITVKF